MSNYTVTTNFGAKDSLPSGNAAKVIKGSEFTTEFNNIATASATKADLASPTFTGTVTIPTATITTANTTTANITTANITTANCDNLSVEKATNSGETDLLIHNTGTGDADAVLKLDSSDTGESEIDFLHDGSLGATIEYFVDGGSPDLNIKTLTSGSVIDLQPNDNLTLRVAEDVVTVSGDLRIANTSEVVKGEIGIVDTDNVYLADNIAGLRMSGADTNNIFPCDQNGAITNEVTNFGGASGRFKTIFSKNALDTSSDRNLKQSIEELSGAEVRVAQACKGLIRKYKWKDSVEIKGVDGSRYHVGVMAQDLEAAFAAEGLNAEEYGMFTRSEETGTLSVSYSELLAFIIGGL